MKQRQVLSSPLLQSSGLCCFLFCCETMHLVRFWLRIVGDIILNTNLHLGPLVCLVAELYYNNFSFPKRHLWVITLYGTSYLLINLGKIFMNSIVYSLSVKVIYEPIDWKSVGSYIICVGSYVFVFGAHYFGGFSYRKWKAHKITTNIT